MSWEGFRKCKTSSAGGSEDERPFPFDGAKRFNEEYAGGSSLSGGEAKVAWAGRGEGGGEYAGGSRRLWGNADGPDETLDYNVVVSIACLGGGSSLDTCMFRECNLPIHVSCQDS